MYQPAAFREDDLATQHGIIRAHPFGLLISTGPEGILANPVPFALYEDGPFGTLRAHLSRGNAQWQALETSPEALIVFQGVDRYVTPSWYETKKETGKVVPTWNYVMAQARGRVVLHHDAEWLHAQVSRLSDHHEADRPEPWAVTDAPEPYVASQLKGIVGVEIVLTSIEAKIKVSQNRPAADREGVLSGLTQEADPASLTMAALLSERHKP